MYWWISGISLFLLGFASRPVYDIFVEVLKNAMAINNAWNQYEKEARIQGKVRKGDEVG